MAWRCREARLLNVTRKAVRLGAVSADKSRPADIRRARRPRRHACWDHLVVAPLWVAYQANLLRTCDAVGAFMAVPDSEHYREALAVGDTLRLARRPCIHWLRTCKAAWVESQRAAGWQIVAVELAEGATQLPRLEPARQRTIVLLGHERKGIPEEVVASADQCVEIPMIGKAPASTWRSREASCSTGSPGWRDRRTRPPREWPACPRRCGRARAAGGGSPIATRRTRAGYARSTSTSRASRR